MSENSSWPVVVNIVPAMFVPQTHRNVLHGVLLFTMNLPVTLGHLVNDGQKRLQLRRPGLRQPIAWRLRMLQHLLPANVVFS
jgi:hypothetical protein